MTLKPEIGRRTNVSEIIEIIDDDETTENAKAESTADGDISMDYEQSNGSLHTNGNQENFTTNHIHQNDLNEYIEKLVDQKFKEKIQQFVQTLCQIFIQKDDLLSMLRRLNFTQKDDVMNILRECTASKQRAENCDEHRKRSRDDGSSNSRAIYEPTVDVQRRRSDVQHIPRRMSFASKYVPQCQLLKNSTRRSTVTSSIRSNQNPSDVPKNIDNFFYLNYGDSKTCPICGKIFRRMTYHFKLSHPDFEVYSSRISSEMVKKIESVNRSAVICTKRSTIFIDAFCLFCGVNKTFQPYYWELHFRSHTGEYAYKCVVCEKSVCFYTHCSTITMRDGDMLNLCVERLYAYICQKCNFIQINEENMRKHLTIQHEMPEKNCDNHYRKILLMNKTKELPSDRSREENVPNEQSTSSSYTQPIIHNGDENMQPCQSGSDVQILDIQIIRSANGTLGINQQFIDSTDTDAMPPPANLNKISPQEEQNLLNIHNNYDRNASEFTVAVRPWMEEDYAKKPVVHLLSQFALYKCMHQQCAFATNDDTKWKQHIEKHFDLLDVLTVNNFITKEIRERHNSFRECPYCGKFSKSNYEFNIHIDESHRSSAFQCYHCFYRTNEMDNIVIHYEKFHNDKSRMVLLCNERREVEDKDYDLLENYCGQNIKKFACGQVGCRHEFACWNIFYAHIREYHATAYKCPYCYQMVDTTKLINMKRHLAGHPLYIKPHEMDEFQCIYCDNAHEHRFHSVNDIKLHMSVAHPSNFLFIGARQSIDPEPDSGDVQIIYAGDMLDHKNYPLYKCLNTSTLNEMNPKSLNAEHQVATRNAINIGMQRVFESVSIEFNVRENIPFLTFERYKQCVETGIPM